MGCAGEVGGAVRMGFVGEVGGAAGTNRAVEGGRSTARSRLTRRRTEGPTGALESIQIHARPGCPGGVVPEDVSVLCGVVFANPPLLRATQ